MYHHQMRLIIILIAQTVLLEAHDATSNKSTKKKSLHMSKIAKDHLSDENNPNDFPKLLGIPFSGCDVHPLMEQSSELVKLVATYGTDADATTLQELAQGFDALQSCSPEESFEIFDAIIQHFPESIFAYIGRGISLGRLANKIKASSESAMKDFDHVMKLKPHFYMAYRCKAEVHFLTGHFKEAMKEAENDLQYKHDGAAYAMAGILSYKLERDYEASQYLVKSHQYVSGHNSVTYEYLGLAYLNMGLLRKSADALKTSLEYEGENMNVCQTLGILYSELGEPEAAHFYLDSALDIKLDESKTMEIKGHVYYASGYPETAVDWYFGCKVKDHSATSCSFMRAVSFATLGRFYESVKLMTFLMLQSSCNSEYREPLYLRDFYRFISRRLDRTLTEYRFDEELPENYRYVWAKKILPNHFNYTEQPGIEPHLKDVDQSITFDDLSDNAKILLCRASEFAYLFQYQVDGFMPNRRANLAMALAAMDVAQTMRNYWKNPKKTKGWKGRQFSWRDLFEVGVKWRKLVSMEQPVLWLDQLPKQIVDAGFITHMFMKKGHVEMPRYAKYMDEALQLAKFMIRSLLNQKLPAKAQEQIMKATTPTEILMILRKYHSTNPNGGFTVGMQVPSSRPKGGLLHGVMLSISGNTEEDITLSIQSARTSAQINQYHSELAYVFSELRDDVTKKKTKDNEKDSTSNLILQLVYYFYNLLPLSRGTSAVAYSVAMGLFMAGNKEFTSQLPGDLQPDIEAYFAGSSEAFIKKMRFWLTLKTMQPPIQNYPSVTDTFETARSILETLNVKVTERTCKNWKVT